MRYAREHRGVYYYSAEEGTSYGGDEVRPVIQQDPSCFGTICRRMESYVIIDRAAEIDP